MRSGSLFLAALLVATVALVAAPAAADELDAAVAAARGSSLPIRSEVEQTARASAARQADANTIGHHSIGHLTAICYQASEVVGHGPDIASIFVAFRNSPGHWAEITKSGWTAMGTGAATASDGSIYVSVIFCKEKSPSPAPSPSTTTTTTAAASRSTSTATPAKVLVASVPSWEPVVYARAWWLPEDEWPDPWDTGPHIV
jgi:hypothetical protein